MLTKRPGHLCPGLFVSILVVRRLDLNPTYTSSVGAFGALLDRELDLVAFSQAAEAISHDCRMVDENVLATLVLDEAEALLIVEPLDGSGYCVSHCWKTFRFLRTTKKLVQNVRSSQQA